MTDSDDAAYFQSRAREEWALSQAAGNPAAALIHSNLAKRYERLAANATTERPTLDVVNVGGPTVSTQPES